jgi:hypothetical protein
VARFDGNKGFGMTARKSTRAMAIGCNLKVSTASQQEAKLTPLQRYRNTVEVGDDCFPLRVGVVDGGPQTFSLVSVDLVLETPSQDSLSVSFVNVSNSGAEEFSFVVPGGTTVLNHTLPTPLVGLARTNEYRLQFTGTDTDYAEGVGVTYNVDLSE